MTKYNYYGCYYYYYYYFSCYNDPELLSLKLSGDMKKEFRIRFKFTKQEISPWFWNEFG